MKKTCLLAALFQLVFFAAFGQVGINILNPDSSAVLQLESSSKGLGLPRLTSPQRDSITNPLNGLTIYNVQDSLIEYWNGACWLKSYQKNCNECEFTMTLSNYADTLDPTVSDSTTTSITLAHTNGNQPISLLYLSSLPAGVTITLNGSTRIDSSATVQIVVVVPPCTNVGGNYPIILEAFCGDEILFNSYNLYIRPPVLVTIANDQTDYNLQTVNTLPSSPPQYVLLNINAGITLHASVNTNPAYTSGNIATSSLVCITNNGNIIGRGGDGAGFTTPSGGGTNVGGGPGAAGGDAMHLTSNTTLINTGAIYAGGSGGSSVGLEYTSPSLPFINKSISVGAGFSGGGGSESGAGGTTNTGGINIGIFENGSNATCCANSTPGTGGVGNTGINIPIVTGFASVEITPSANGGNGGAFAQQGTEGNVSLTIQLQTILGNINVYSSSVYNGPASGSPGVAIKRYSNTLTGGITDGNYNNTEIKGVVGP